MIIITLSRRSSYLRGPNFSRRAFTATMTVDADQARAGGSR
ncbi:hypothetical protein [Dehalogenimonas alkenigignens]|nr:hypothetical protein [Dehalogenimonas alkenigignens]